jgi:predicted NAD/FAD-binding protein
MRIAIVGSGVSGLVAAHLLHPRHEIVLFEADERIGGHVHTHVVETPRGRVAVDTGFIVHNDRTYPHFLRLLQALGVASVPTSMGFSVRCERSGLEWSGESPNALFAQRRNLVSPAFWRMLRDLVRFQRAGRAFLSARDVTSSLDDFLHAGGFGAELRRFYLEPMIASVWSADPERVGAFPAHALLRFFENHGLLGFTDRPQWRVVEGGSARYVDALVRPFADRIRTKSAASTGCGSRPTHPRASASTTS